MSSSASAHADDPPSVHPVEDDAAPPHFDVGAFLAGRPSGALDPQPQQVGAGWSKASRLAGGAYTHGDWRPGLLPYAGPPALPADLDAGFDDFVGKPMGERVGVEVVAAAAAAATPGGLAAAAAAAAAAGRTLVVSFRSNLNKIGGAAFDARSPWAVDACALRCGGAAAGGSPGGGGGGARPLVLFLDIVADAPGGFQDTPEGARATYRGYKFEALCTGEGVADATSEYGALLSLGLAEAGGGGGGGAGGGSGSEPGAGLEGGGGGGGAGAGEGPGGGPGVALLMGAEIDCYDPALAGGGRDGGPAGGAAAAAGAGAGAPPPPPPPLASLLELKTYRVPQHRGQHLSIARWKHPKWWLQSALAGVPALALGGRDDGGRLLRVDRVRTAELPRLSAAAGAPFAPGAALALLAAALRWAAAVAGGREGVDGRLSYDPAARRVRWRERGLAADDPERLALRLRPYLGYNSPAGGAGRKRKAGGDAPEAAAAGG